MSQYVSRWNKSYSLLREDVWTPETNCDAEKDRTDATTQPKIKVWSPQTFGIKSIGIDDADDDDDGKARSFPSIFPINIYQW